MPHAQGVSAALGACLAVGPARWQELLGIGFTPL